MKLYRLCLKQESFMNYELSFDLDKFKGVGPAGKIIRIISRYSFAKKANLPLKFTKKTAEWWTSAFSSSSFFEVHNDSQNLEDCFTAGLVDSVCLNWKKEDRRDFQKQCAQEILQIRPSILKEVDAYNFGNYYGVYRRGTDKITEAPYYPFCLFEKIIDPLLKEKEHSLVGISDSEFLLQEIRDTRPDYNLKTTITMKSSNEKCLHLHTKFPQEFLLKEALLDALIMSRSQVLIYSPSMMVNLAQLLNPNLRIVSVESVVDLQLREVLKSVAKYIKHLYTIPK